MRVTPRTLGLSGVEFSFDGLFYERELRTVASPCH